MASSRYGACMANCYGSPGGELRRRSSYTGVAGPELDDLAHQATADALLAITGKLDQFRFESRFTTWAYRFVMLEVSNKLGRHFWATPRIFLDEEAWERLPAAFGLDPQRQAEWQELVDALQRAVQETLTPYQRRLFVAIVPQRCALGRGWSSNSAPTATQSIRRCSTPVASSDRCWWLRATSTTRRWSFDE